MPTQAEVQDAIKKRLIRKQFADAAWSDIVAAVQASTGAQRNQVVVAVQEQDMRRLGQALGAMLKAWAETAADAEAAAIVADSTLSFDELERVYGPL